MHLRPFAPCDLPGMYRVCLLTGAAGADATDRYRDPDLLAHLYAGAYPTADPSLSWVVHDDDSRLVGYLVATADSRAFAAWQEAHWWPALRRRYPLPDPADRSADADAVRIVHAGQSVVEQVVDRFPAHLHIDLLPAAQGRGLGRRLIDTLAAALRERGVPGVHLTMDVHNTGAGAFYRRLGFTESVEHPGAVTLVLDLTAG